MTTTNAETLLSTRDLIAVGVQGDDIRRRMHGVRTTFVRVFETHVGEPLPARPAGLAAGEFRIVGRPATEAAATAAVKATAALAAGVPVTGFSLADLHALAPDPKQIEATKAGLDALVAKPITGRELWWWCDALYMCPPTLAKLATATGDKKYLEALDRWYWDAYVYLYDPESALFYRDKRYLFPTEGQKVFWSRGNGWVIAGLSRLLDALPKDYPLRTKYIALYQAMAAKLVAVQPADGLWRANLLDATGAHGEASGSAFFCYALAWGINEGLLPADKYRPAVDKTWAALLTCVDAEGRLGWVQPIGFAPDHYDATTYQEYGAGAFLAAGSQMMKLK